MDDEDLGSYIARAEKFVGRFQEYYSSPNCRRRFMKKCSALPDDELRIITSVLSGTDVLEDPDIKGYLETHIDAVERLDDLLEETDGLISTTDNRALHRLLIFMAQYDEEMEHGFNHWEISENPHIDADTIRQWIQFIRPHLDFAPELANDVITHPNMPSDVLHDLAQIKNMWHLRAVAKHPNCSEETHIFLLKDTRWKVREAIAMAPTATDAVLLKLIDDNKKEVGYAVRRTKSTSKIVLESLFLNDIPMFKNQITQLLKYAPHYAWIEPGPKNKIHKKSLVVAQSNATSPPPTDDIIHDFRARKTQYLGRIDNAIKSNTEKMKHEADALDQEYQKHPENWQEIIKNKHCSEALIRRIFIDCGDVLLNPKVQDRLTHDLNYPKRLFPRSRKERLTIAKTNPYLYVLWALFYREEEKETDKQDIGVMTILAQNECADSDLLYAIYDEFNIKEVVLNKNCTKELRKKVLQTDPNPLRDTKK